MVKKEEMKVEMNNDGDIFVNGKKYTFNKTKFKKIGKETHIDKYQYKEFKEDEIKKYEKIIIDKLKTQTNIDELLKETLRNIPIKHLKRISKRIIDKKKIVKHMGCLGFKIGDTYLELFD